MAFKMNGFPSHVGVSPNKQKDLVESHDTKKAKKADRWKTGEYLGGEIKSKTKKNILTGKTRVITKTKDDEGRKIKTVDKYDKRGNLIKTKQKKSDKTKKVVKYKKGRTITKEKSKEFGNKKTWKTHDITKGSDKGTFVSKHSKWGLSGGEYEGGAGANSTFSTRISDNDFKKGKKGAHVGAGSTK